METAEALSTALTLSAHERQLKASFAYSLVERYDPDVWISQQINDLNQVIAAKVEV